MSGNGTPVVVVTDDGGDGAEFAAGHATATAEQAAETAEHAEQTAELALDVAEQAAEMAAQTAAETAEAGWESDVTKEEFEAFQAETRGTLGAILDRLDQADAPKDDAPAGPPAPAPKDDAPADDAPTDNGDQADGDQADDDTNPKPKTKGRKGYGSRRWFGDDDE